MKKKSAWQKPELIVLVRTIPSTAVIMACRGGTNCDGSSGQILS